MRRRQQSEDNQSISQKKTSREQDSDIGLVLSGGGSRAAYQVGALKALHPFMKRDLGTIRVVVGSSIGAINGLLFSSCLKDGYPHTIEQMQSLWLERTFRNTFSGTPSQAFVRAIRMAIWQYMSPGPNPSDKAIFDPTPLMNRVDQVILAHGGLTPEARHPDLRSVAVMTTIEGTERKPLLFVSSHKEIDLQLMQGASFDVCYVSTLTAKHGFASAALPSVLPPVELDTQHGKVRLVDGGISQNVPVDPAARLGANKVILVDISGRSWWLDRYDEAHDKRPDWEIEAGPETFCVRPPETFVLRNERPMGPLLKEAVGDSTRKFAAAVGPTWPVFKLLKTKLGEEVAYEVMSYVALDPDYVQGLIEQGYNETMKILRNQQTIQFEYNADFAKLQQAVL